MPKVPRLTAADAEGMLLKAGFIWLLGMDMGTSLDGCNDRHANVGYVFQDLSAFVMDLAPYAGIGNVGETFQG